MSNAEYEAMCQEQRALRPDLIPFAESTRFALTWDDVRVRAEKGDPYPLQLSDNDGHGSWWGIFPPEVRS